MMEEAGNDNTRRIKSLSEQNRASHSPDLEAELVRLRMDEGRRRCDGSSSAIVTRPSSTDLFSDIQGLPEIPATELSGATLAAGILHHGALLVRGLYQPTQLATLRELAAAQEGERPWDEVPPEHWARSLFILLEIYRDSGLLEAVGDYLGDEPVILTERTKLRNRRAGRDNYSAIPWHQDVNFFGTRSFAVNCWAAVTSCGKDNPGLGFIPCRTEQRIGWAEKNGIAPLNYGNTMPTNALNELTARHPAVYPVLQPGDALLFDEMTVHRTASRPWKMKVQTVTISWFFRASGFPASGIPLAV